MAVTAMGATLTAQHRLQQIAVRSAMLRNLQRLWPMFTPADWNTFDDFSALAATLVQVGNQASAALAARYLVAFRVVEGQPDSIPPVIAPPPPVGVIRDELRATGLLGTLDALRAGKGLPAASGNGWVRVAGSATSLVLDGGRETIVETVAADPRVSYWQRVTGGDPCAFCAMLATRGAVYKESTVDFQAHDHCSCSAEPEYADSALPPASERFASLWYQSTAGLSGNDALNAFRQSLAGGDAGATAGQP